MKRSLFLAFFIGVLAAGNSYSQQSTLAPQAPFIIHLTTDSAAAGEFIDIPIILNDPIGARALGASFVYLNISYNATLLEPIAPTPTAGTIRFGYRNTAVTFPIPTTADTIIGVVHFRAALGNSLQTSLHIDSTATDTLAVPLTKQDGTFILAGVCDAGGKRLLNPTGKPTVSIKQNPANSTAIIAVTLIEKGASSLIVSDIMGRKVDQFNITQIEPGITEIAIPLSRYSAGNYLLSLQTPTAIVSQMMEVRK